MDKWGIRWVKITHLTLSIYLPAVQVTCASPPELQGQKVIALDSKDLGCPVKQRFPREDSTAQQITVTYSNSKLCRCIW